MRLKGDVACALTGIFPGFEDGLEEEIIKGKPRIPFKKLMDDHLASLTHATSTVASGEPEGKRNGEMA